MVLSLRAGSAHYIALRLALIVFSVVSTQAVAAQSENAKPREEASDIPLQVQVVPRALLKRAAQELKTEEDFFKALGNTYIIMKDGSVLSSSDWILGSLKKDRSGALMTNYESRLFLGQTARAALGLDETLVHQNYVNTGELVSFDNRPRISGPMQAAQGLFKMLVPGRNREWHGAKAGGSFSPTMKTGQTGNVLFEEQFNESIMWTAEEFKEIGTMRIMLNDYLKRNREE